MTAPVIAFRPAGRGRQPAAVEALRDDRDELTALMAEGRDLGRLIVALARQAQVLLARDQSPATVLDELERIGGRQTNRMTAAIAHAHVGDACMDGSVDLGHGAAA